MYMQTDQQNISLLRKVVFGAMMIVALSVWVLLNSENDEVYKNSRQLQAIKVEQAELEENLKVNPQKIRY